MNFDSIYKATHLDECVKQVLKENGMSGLYENYRKVGFAKFNESVQKNEMMNEDFKKSLRNLAGAGLMAASVLSPMALTSCAQDAGSDDTPETPIVQVEEEDKFNKPVDLSEFDNVIAYELSLSEWAQDSGDIIISEDTSIVSLDITIDKEFHASGTITPLKQGSTYINKSDEDLRLFTVTVSEKGSITLEPAKEEE